MDAVESRRRCGSHLALFGNIDALKLGGPQDALEAELRRTVPLAPTGGYIMHSEHSCPPEVTFDQYSWMHKTAQRIFEEATWVRFPVFGETTCDCDTNEMSSSDLPSIKVAL